MLFNDGTKNTTLVVTTGLIDNVFELTSKLENVASEYYITKTEDWTVRDDIGHFLSDLDEACKQCSYIDGELHITNGSDHKVYTGELRQSLESHLLATGLMTDDGKAIIAGCTESTLPSITMVDFNDHDYGSLVEDDGTTDSFRYCKNTGDVLTVASIHTGERTGIRLSHPKLTKEFVVDKSTMHDEWWNLTKLKHKLETISTLYSGDIPHGVTVAVGQDLLKLISILQNC